MKYEKKVPIPIFLVDLVLIKTDNFKEVMEYYHVEGDGNYTAFVLDNQKGEIVLVYNEFDWPVMVHEIVHVTNAVFKRCHIEPSLSNDETQAYLSGWLASVLIDFEDLCITAMKEKEDPAEFVQWVKTNKKKLKRIVNDLK